MSIFQPKTNFVIRARRADGASAAHANDAVLRATGVVSLLAIGAVHFLQIVPTTESTPLLGVSFLFLIAACLAVAARLATRGDHRTWTASAVVCGAAIGGSFLLAPLARRWTTKMPATGRACSGWPPCS